MGTAGDPRRARTLVATLVALLACVPPSDRGQDAGQGGQVRAETRGVSFEPLDLAEALARAAARQQRVVLYFGAGWCPPCHALHREVFERPDARSLLGGLVLVERDFDQPSSRPLVERFAIIQLPVVVVLQPDGGDGVEVARIEGYEGREPWIAAMRAARGAVDPMPALRAATEARPGDARAWLALGRAALARSHPEQGEAALERAVWLGGAAGERAARDAAAEALFVLGRYYQRVRRDFRTARHVWRELAMRFADSPAAAGAWYWHADAQKQLGRWELGMLAYRQRADAQPRDLDAQMQWAELAAEVDAPAERAAARGRLAALRDTAPAESRSELDALLRRLDARIATDRAGTAGAARPGASTD